MPSSPTPRPMALLAAAAACLAAVALAACGGTASGNPPSASAADEARAEKFARCLREHGVQAEVDKGGGGFGLKVKGKAGSPSGGPEAFEAAQKACARYRPAGRKVKLSPAQEAELRDRVLRFARCMREHGIEIPNPETGAGDVRIHIQGNLDPESPKFQAAQRACQSFMPAPKGAPGPGFQSSGGTGSSGASLGIGG